MSEMPQRKPWWGHPGGPRVRFRLRRKPYHFACPYCGGPFFTIHEASMVGRRNRLPLLESMRGDIHCDAHDCGRTIPFEWFVNDRRGWHEKYRRECIKWTGRPNPYYPWDLVDAASVPVTPEDTNGTD